MHPIYPIILNPLSGVTCITVPSTIQKIKQWQYHLKTLPSWWFQPIWKILVKLDHLPRDRVENKKYLSCHHLATNCNLCKAKKPPSVRTPGPSDDHLALNHEKLPPIWRISLCWNSTLSPPQVEELSFCAKRHADEMLEENQNHV